jgi:hypothetical protein
LSPSVTGVGERISYTHGMESTASESTIRLVPRLPRAVSGSGHHSQCRFGEWLVRRGVIDREQLFWALSATYRHGCRLGDAVVVLGYSSSRRVEAEAEILCARP